MRCGDTMLSDERDTGDTTLSRGGQRHLAPDKTLGPDRRLRTRPGGDAGRDLHAGEP